jgi:hypothetical protein
MIKVDTCPEQKVLPSSHHFGMFVEKNSNRQNPITPSEAAAALKCIKDFG